MEDTEKNNKFISEWEIFQQNEAIELPLYKKGKYNFLVDWGDGTTNKIKEYDTDKKFHAYKSPGIYTVKIEGKINGITFKDNFSCENIISILNWGSVNLNHDSDNCDYFKNCKNLEILAVDSPHIGSKTNFTNCFANCLNLKTGVKHWNVSDVRIFDKMFLNCFSYNEDLNNWDVSSAISLSSMFENCKLFSSILSKWDVSNVMNFNKFASGIKNFIGKVSSWDVRCGTDFGNMFLNSKISDEEYTELLQSWSSLPLCKIYESNKQFNAGNSFYFKNAVSSRDKLKLTIGVFDLGNNAKFIQEEDCYFTFAQIKNDCNKNTNSLNAKENWIKDLNTDQYNAFIVPIKKTNKLYSEFLEFFISKKNLINIVISFEAFNNTKSFNFGNPWKLRDGLYKLIEKQYVSVGKLCKIKDVSIEKENLIDLSDFCIIDFSHKKPMCMTEDANSIHRIELNDTEFMCSNFSLLDTQFESTSLNFHDYKSEMTIDPSFHNISDESGPIIYRNNDSAKFIIFNAYCKSNSNNNVIYVSTKQNNKWSNFDSLDDHLGHTDSLFNTKMSDIIIEDSVGLSFCDSNNILCITKTTSLKTYVYLLEFKKDKFELYKTIVFEGQIKKSFVVRPNLDLMVMCPEPIIVKYDKSSDRYKTDELISLDTHFKSTLVKSFAVNSGTSFLGVKLNPLIENNYFKSMQIIVNKLNIGADSNHLTKDANVIEIPFNIEKSENQYHDIFGSCSSTQKNTSILISSYNNIYSINFYDVDFDFQSNNRSICPFILGNDSETRLMVSKSNLILKSLVTSNKLIQVVLRNSKKNDERILSYLCSNLEIDIYNVCPESLKLSLYKSESILNLIGKETLINKVNKFNADNFITEYCDNKELVNLINLTTDCSLNKVELIIS